MIRTVVVGLLLLLAVVSAQQAEWDLVGPADSDASVQLTVAIKQQNLEELERIFWEVSTPSSPLYGKFMTADEVSKLVMPTEENIQAVLQWLSSFGINDVEFTRSRDFVSFTTSASVASALLNTKFMVHKHKVTGKTIIKAAGSYEIPSELKKTAVDFVSGHIGFPLTKKPIYAVGPVANVGAPGPVTPVVLRTRYNVTSNIVGSNGNNSYAVAEFQEQYYSPSDLQTFFKNEVPLAANDYNVDHVVGSNEASDPGVEASLDIQFIKGIAPNITSWFWSNPSMDFFSDMINWLAQIDNTTDAPLVHSISYGSQDQWPTSDIHDRVDQEFIKIGARGISIIFASGDYGTGCILCVKFRPSWPASSQYVTAVGATQFINGFNGPESAVSQFGSGGGFSSADNQPSYQSAAVAQYFKVQSDLPEPFYYNKSGRGTPDVAALGIGFEVYVSGVVQLVGGTSASAPTFSAIISLLNDQRLNAGKSPLGFLNPWLYQTQASNPDAFFDVTQGSNQHGCCGLTGWKCAPGWDPVTGLGTPNFAVLSQLV